MEDISIYLMASADWIFALGHYLLSEVTFSQTSLQCTILQGTATGICCLVFQEIWDVMNKKLRKELFLFWSYPCLSLDDTFLVPQPYSPKMITASDLVLGNL